MKKARIKKILEKLDVIYTKDKAGNIEIAEEITVKKLINIIKIAKKVDFFQNLNNETSN